MKSIICVLAIVVIAYAQSNKQFPAAANRGGYQRPTESFQRTGDADAYILRFISENSDLHSYKFGFDTSNGISRDEQGTLTNVGTENEAMEVAGGYEYTDPLKRKVTVTYTAGVNGFIPTITYT
ncbi:hypothetical protein FQA39_LY11942 [Lamprigera yunnana]|nr:hypothetical protein FQA39_LY11942 [Lamprigera yunnana]